MRTDPCHSNRRRFQHTTHNYRKVFCSWLAAPIAISLRAAVVARLQHQIRLFFGLPGCLIAPFQCKSGNRLPRGVNHYANHFATHSYGVRGFARRSPAFWNMKRKLDQIAFGGAIRTSDQDATFTHIPRPAFTAAGHALCVPPVISDRRPQRVAHVSSPVRDSTPIDFVQICVCLGSTSALGRWKSHLSQRINAATKAEKKPNVCVEERICFSGHSGNPGAHK